MAQVDQAEWWAEFNIFQDRDARYYWQLEAAGGRIIVQSGHPQERQVLVRAGRELAAGNAGLIMVYDHTGPWHRLAV
jgi:hypothetical protein